ncbi:MAG: DUF2782 domain-containing protein [Proteobacteria bacterium]|nr:DUF2782 domain-containing protein [Pseudomonadota bacterium]
MPETLAQPGLKTAFAALCLAACLSAYAEDSPRLESLKGPDVTIISGEERTIFEYRQNGYLRMIKIVPNFGKPYYLVPADPSKGFDDLRRADMLLPSWKIFEF